MSQSVERTAFLSEPDDRPGNSPHHGTTSYNQLLFEGLEETQPHTIAVDNVRGDSTLVLKKQGVEDEWICAVEYQRDLWHQEEHGLFLLHSTQHSEEIKRLRIRPGEMLAVEGVLWKQHVPLQGG